MAIVQVDQHHDFATEPADQELEMARGEIVAGGKGIDMVRDGRRERMSI